MREPAGQSTDVIDRGAVCTPEQAYRCFLATDMDVLVLENAVLLKEDQPKLKPDEVDRYLAQFQLD